MQGKSTCYYPQGRIWSFVKTLKINIFKVRAMSCRLSGADRIGVPCYFNHSEIWSSFLVLSRLMKLKRWSKETVGFFRCNDLRFWLFGVSSVRQIGMSVKLQKWQWRYLEDGDDKSNKVLSALHFEANGRFGINRFDRQASGQISNRNTKLWPRNYIQFTLYFVVTATISLWGSVRKWWKVTMKLSGSVFFTCNKLRLFELLTIRMAWKLEATHDNSPFMLEDSWTAG